MDKILCVLGFLCVLIWSFWQTCKMSEMLPEQDCSLPDLSKSALITSISKSVQIQYLQHLHLGNLT